MKTQKISAYLAIFIFLTIADLVLQSDLAFCMDQSLLRRPRGIWEYNPKSKPTDVDHLGRGWDQLYKANFSKTEHERKFCYEQAENEFKFVINYVMRYASEKNVSLVNHLFIGAAKGMAQVGIRTKRPHLAMQIYEIGIRQHEKVPILYVHYAQYLRLIGLLPEAIGIMEKAVVLWPKKAGLHYYVGLLYFENKYYDKARSEVKITDELGGVNTNDLKKKLDSLPEGTVEKKD